MGGARFPATTVAGMSDTSQALLPRRKAACLCTSWRPTDLNKQATAFVGLVSELRCLGYGVVVSELKAWALDAIDWQRGRKWWNRSICQMIAAVSAQPLAHSLLGNEGYATGSVCNLLETVLPGLYGMKERIAPRILAQMCSFIPYCIPGSACTAPAPAQFAEQIMARLPHALGLDVCTDLTSLPEPPDRQHPKPRESVQRKEAPKSHQDIHDTFNRLLL